MPGKILSVDIGSSSLKAALIDSEGRLIAFSRKAYPLELHSGSLGSWPQGSCGAGGACGSQGTLGAHAWERAFFLALEEICIPGNGLVIDAICISGNGPTLVPVTGDGRALAPLYWHGKKSPPGSGGDAPSFFLPHAAYFKKENPEAYKETALFLSSHEWLAHSLGAPPLTVLPHAAYMPYYWDDGQCRLFDLEGGKFPPFIASGGIMGKVSQGAAGRYAGASANLLKSGIPIVAGGPDFISALIGTGTMSPSMVCDRAGSSEGINACASAPVGGGGLRVLPHAREGLWNIGAVIESSGSLFERHRAISGQENRPYEEHLAELIPSPDDPEIFRNIPNSVSVIGQSALGVPNSPLEQGRAVLCAIGFAVRRAIEALEAQGLTVKEMRVSGGQGKNSRWNRLKADIAGVTLLIPEILDGELAGNAVLAAAALGCTSGTDEAALKMIRFRETFAPRSDSASFWEERYGLWRRGT